MPSRVPRAVCLGEAMVVFTPLDAAPLSAAETFRRSVGGAEANVAGTLAALGVATSWVSRVGEDPFGRAVTADLAARGVDVGGVECDPDRPTGLYVKEPTAGGSRMHYYRAGSAAAAMDADLLTRPVVAERLAGADLVHTSGITAGILQPGSTLLTRLAQLRAGGGGFRLSVDLNWRPQLWRTKEIASLVAVLRQADLILLGADEAVDCLGTADPFALRDIVGHRATLVLKGDAHAATALEPDGRRTAVPALSVGVVEPVGAGDGFAAGYLAGELYGLPTVQRLRLGHLAAASVLAAEADHARPPGREIRDALLHCTDEDWRRTRVDRDGVTSPALPSSEAIR